NREPEGLGGLEVDDQLELRRLLDGEVAGLGALEDFVHVGGGAPPHVSEVDAVRYEPALIHVKVPEAIRRREPMPGCPLHHPPGLPVEKGTRDHEDNIGPPLGGHSERAVDLPWSLDL